MNPRKALLSAALAANLAGLGCASTNTQPAGVGGITVLPMQASVYLRATYDSDASSMIGAFLPDDVPDELIDESRAMRTRCSDYIKVRTVPASGEVEELFGASAGVGGKLGVKSIAHLKASRAETSALRIKYVAVEKMQAEVDTKGLYECCQAAPDQCPKRFIASSLKGTAKIYAATEKSDEYGLEGSGSLKGVPIDGDILYKDGLKWERKSEIKEAQYFSFSLGTAMGPVASKCDAGCGWARNVPRSLDGVYFVGVSEPIASERAARDRAMRDARQQVVKYLGDWLSQESKAFEDLSGAIGGGIGGTMDDEQAVSEMSEGLARRVKDECWCDPERQATPGGNMYVSRVLTFFPNSERAAAAKSVLESLKSNLKAKEQLTPEREKAIADALAEIK